MARLFVAVDLPSDRRAAIAALRDDGLDARWAPEDQYHITLRFIGEVDKERQEALREDLRGISASRFSLAGAGLDVFPSRRRPRILVARVERDPELKRLQEAVERVAVQNGLEPEPKTFNPHVTFARLKRGNPREIRRFLKANDNLQIASFYVDAFHLYQSDLSPSGAEHSVVETYPLETAPA